MKLNKTSVALKVLNAVTLYELKATEDNTRTVLALNAEMMALGFVMSASLLEAAKCQTKACLVELSKELLTAMRELKGADVNYSPVYPNFPQQVVEADDVELYMNALLHYWTFGQWKPHCNEKRDKLPRQLAFDESKFIEIDLIDEKAFANIFTTILKSSDSISSADKAIVEWFIDHTAENDLVFPSEIPFLENKCAVAALLLKKGKDVSDLVKTATDVLRIASYYSGGDVSLAENTKFKSMARPLRRQLVLALERVINEEDIGRHRNKWIKLFHNLHVGDYSKKVFDIAAKARSGMTLHSFNGRVEACINQAKVLDGVELLKQRPGEFGRRIDKLLRLAKSPEIQRQVIVDFLAVAEKVSTRNLLQLLGHTVSRLVRADKKVVFPKGNAQKAVMLRKSYSPLSGNIAMLLIGGIRELLKTRFANQGALGKVWINPELIDCPIPSQQRSASSGLFNVARGTRLPIADSSDNNTLRFFIYWVGRDIDLSASFHDENFNLIERVSYTNLRASGYKAYHSGDITSAPNGACEFVDVTMDQALNSGARYIAMNVLVYSGPKFSEHQDCYAGWMTRSKPNSGEIFDPKTVTQKIDVRSNSRNVIPVIFDLKEKQAIWTDITTSSRTQWGGNNVESNAATIEEKIEAMTAINNKVSLYELFDLHAAARGELVDSKTEADCIFDIDEGITPYHINEINAEYIA